MMKKTFNTLYSLIIGLALGVMLYACSDKREGQIILVEGEQREVTGVDNCGYTWYKIRPASSYITIVEVDSWMQLPGKHRRPGVVAAHIPTSLNIDASRWQSTIYINTSLEITTGGHCNTRLHELRHANGEDHVEEHIYTPKDYARPMKLDKADNDQRIYERINWHRQK